jgi:glucose-6-phosphate isomerase, archaeal
MDNLPFSVDVVGSGNMLSRFDNHIQRKLSSMKGQFLDQQTYQEMLDKEDILLYEVYELKRPEVAGELLSGMSIVHPGKVGNEFFMTKGHFHTVLETGEVYYCLRGQGCMVMENPEGDCTVEELRPGRILYVPPRWAHRSVNTGQTDDLITIFVYPGNAGHDYGTIERQGFRKLVVELDGRQEIISNPRWTRAGD